MKERTMVILKPDCLQRAIAGQVIARIEDKGLKIVGLKLAQLSHAQAEIHYAEHRGKGFFEDAVSFLCSSPVVLMVLEADSVIRLTRNLTGATMVEDALPGTIRGDFDLHTRHNIIHASDTPASAEREIGLYFEPSEILDYQRDIDRWT